MCGMTPYDYADELRNLLLQFCFLPALATARFGVAILHRHRGLCGDAAILPRHHGLRGGVAVLPRDCGLRSGAIVRPRHRGLRGSGGAILPRHGGAVVPRDRGLRGGGAIVRRHCGLRGGGGALVPCHCGLRTGTRLGSGRPPRRPCRGCSAEERSRGPGAEGAPRRRPGKAPQQLPAEPRRHCARSGGTAWHPACAKLA
mmetsp:Transcript_102556/g.249272  ORF Transcript_102556/g.249272 Transcript_102556/m.249272 type:complete len:200 (-) Transcript_102556:6-605(-)